MKCLNCDQEAEKRSKYKGLCFTCWNTGIDDKDEIITAITQERDKLREENARLRHLITRLVAGDQMTRPLDPS